MCHYFHNLERGGVAVSQHPLLTMCRYSNAARAWTYANARVVEHISLMVTMSDYWQQFIELKFEDRLSVADAVELEHHVGLTKTANFVAEVDPWCYPHDDSPATIGVKNYVHSVVNKAAHALK